MVIIFVTGEYFADLAVGLSLVNTLDMVVQSGGIFVLFPAFLTTKLGSLVPVSGSLVDLSFTICGEGNFTYRALVTLVRMGLSQVATECDIAQTNDLTPLAFKDRVPLLSFVSTAMSRFHGLLEMAAQQLDGRQFPTADKAGESESQKTFILIVIVKVGKETLQIRFRLIQIQVI